MSFVTGTQAELLYSMPANGASVTGTTSTGGTQQLVSQVNGATTPAFQLPSYFFPNTYGAGKSILIQGGGVLLNGATTESLRLNVYLDTTVGTQSILLASTGAFSPFGTSVSQTGSFMFELLCTAQSVGTGGTIACIGRVFTGQSGSTATVSSPAVILMGQSSQPTFNNSVAYYIDVFANFGGTTTTQAITLTNMLVWGLN